MVVVPRPVPGIAQSPALSDSAKGLSRGLAGLEGARSQREGLMGSSESQEKPIGDRSLGRPSQKDILLAWEVWTKLPGRSAE